MVPDAISGDPPDKILKNKIVRAKWAGGVNDKSSKITEGALDRVTPDMVARVREELADDGAEMDQRMRATPANARTATDGGGRW